MLSVATEKNIQATAYSNPSNPYITQPTYQGQWQAGKVTVKTHAHFCIEDQPVAYQAMCTFTFTGTDRSSQELVTENDSVKLVAHSHVLQVEGIETTSVLCHTDTRSSAVHQNTLNVTSNHILMVE